MRLTVMGETKSSLFDGNLSFSSEKPTAVFMNGPRSLIIWGEHCTDCANPTCYATCSLYSPRLDLKCRRFESGLERVIIVSENAIPREAMRLKFRKWAKLEGEGSAAIVSSATADMMESFDRAVGRILDISILPYVVKRPAIKAWNWFKRRLISKIGDIALCESFLFDAINSDANDSRLVLSLQNSESPSSIFQTALDLRPGFNSFMLPRREFEKLVPLGRKMRIAIESADGKFANLIVLRSDFIGNDTKMQSQIAPKPPGQKLKPGVKCVVWDLDNTLWQGTLVEDGSENLVLNPQAVATIVELDRRGVLNSIASKNNWEHVEPILKHFGLAEYFLFPQVHWKPKSHSVKQIASDLNIGVDTFLLVDDNPFERSEVAQALPQVECFDVADLVELMNSARLPNVITSESKKRRSMYRAEQARTVAMVSSPSDYLSFLKSCDLTLTLDKLGNDNLNRVFELTERTNQLNYFSRRFSMTQLKELASKHNHINCVVLSAKDKFGDYGIIGFAVVNELDWIVEDFFMSCRVQRKMVDHAFFDWVRERADASGAKSLRINFRSTNRNSASKEVLQSMLFVASDNPDGTSTYSVPVSRAIPDHEVVVVEANLR
jgi:FkbH-like protein